MNSKQNFIPAIISGNNSKIIRTGYNSNVRFFKNINVGSDVEGILESECIQLQPGSTAYCSDGQLVHADPITGCVNCPNGLLPGSSIYCPYQNNSILGYVDEFGNVNCNTFGGCVGTNCPNEYAFFNSNGPVTLEYIQGSGSIYVAVGQTGATVVPPQSSFIFDSRLAYRVTENSNMLGISINVETSSNFTLLGRIYRSEPNFANEFNDIGLIIVMQNESSKQIEIPSIQSYVSANSYLVVVFSLFVTSQTESVIFSNLSASIVLQPVSN